jgi:hypothetical protein
VSDTELRDTIWKNIIEESPFMLSENETEELEMIFGKQEAAQAAVQDKVKTIGTHINVCCVIVLK